MPQPIKVLGLAEMTYHRACSAIRTLWPLVALNNRADFECQWIDGRDAMKKLVSGRSYEFAGRDLYTISRIQGPTNGEDPYQFFTGKTVYETDDDLSDEFRDFGQGEWVKGMIHFADAVTVSTKPLGERYAKLHGKPTFVIPNHINRNFYSSVSLAAERMDDRLTIGLVGTASHWADWIKMIEPLKKIKERYPDVLIACGGYCPPYLKDVVDRFYGPLPFEEYPKILRQVDIRLSPLDYGDRFNESKSSIAALEAMASTRPIGVKQKLGGAVAVCADHVAYRGTVQNKTNGMLVKEGDWYEVIAELIEDEKLRERLAINGHKWVRNTRSMQQAAPMWAHAFHTIVGR